MITITKTFYQCSLCKKEYTDIKEAEECNARSIQNDVGIQVGDIVKVTMGECKGLLGKVTGISIADKYWGHYFWEKYWHTPVYTIEIINKSCCTSATYNGLEKK